MSKNPSHDLRATDEREKAWPLQMAVLWWPPVLLGQNKSERALRRHGPVDTRFCALTGGPHERRVNEMPRLMLRAPSVKRKGTSRILSAFACTHFSTSSTKCFATWRSVVATSFALSRRLGLSGCRPSRNRHCIASLNGAWSIDVKGVPLSVYEDRTSIVPGVDDKSTECKI